MSTTPKPIYVYFHLYAAGDWVEPWTDFITGVTDTGLYDRMVAMKVGIVGLPSQREAAKELIKTYGDKIEVLVEADRGYEQLTLDVLNKEVQDQDFYCLYAHTKGAAYRRPQNSWWRRDMIRHTVRRWAEAVEALDNGYDAAGIFWRSRPQLGPRSPVLDPHFSGNFWWAKSEYLRTLGPPLHNTRYDAEAWIGRNLLIRWLDLNPGAPSQGPAKPKRPGALKRSFMMGDKITVLVSAQVMGPMGLRLKPGTVVELDDVPYTRLLVKSGQVFLIDPPSLDPEFLEKLRQAENGTSDGESDSTPVDASGSSDPESDDEPGGQGSSEDVGTSAEGYDDSGELVLDGGSNSGRKARSTNRIK